MPTDPAAMQDLASFRLPPNWRGRPGWVVLLWQLVQSTLFAISPQPMYGFRRALLRLFGAKIGVGVIFRPTSRITYPWKLEVGYHSWIGDHVELYNLGLISIGRNSVISQRSYVCTGSHDHTTPAFTITRLPIVIGDAVWVATDVFIAPGVTIGSGAIVGARSSVFHDIPELGVAKGSPAMIHRMRA